MFENIIGLVTEKDSLSPMYVLVRASMNANTYIPQSCELICFGQSFKYIGFDYNAGLTKKEAF